MNKYWKSETASGEKDSYASQTSVEEHYPSNDDQLGYVKRLNIDPTVSYQRSTPYFFHIERPSFNGKSIFRHQILEQELWKGNIIADEGEIFLIELRNSRYPQIVRRLKVKKTRVMGDISRAFVGIQVELKYIKVRDLDGKVKKSTLIRLQQYADIPLERREDTFEKKMMLYSYMFSDDD